MKNGEKKIFNSTKICIKATLLLPDIEPLTEKVFDSEILSANISISPNFCLQLGQSAGLYEVYNSTAILQLLKIFPHL